MDSDALGMPASFDSSYSSGEIDGVGSSICLLRRAAECIPAPCHVPDIAAADVKRNGLTGNPAVGRASIFPGPIQGARDRSAVLAKVQRGSDLSRGGSTPPGSCQRGVGQIISSAATAGG